MNICFYTDTHLGDVLLSNPFVHKICKSNPNETFFQWCLCGNELLMGPNNLKYLEIIIDNDYEDGFVSGNAPEQYTENTNLKQMFIKHHHTDIFVLKYKDIEYIALNIWCLPLGCSNDAKYDQLYNGFHNKIQKINQLFNKKYDFHSFEPYEMLPYLKPIENIIFDKWNITQDFSKKRIFFYNFVSRISKSYLDMYLFLKKAAEQLPDYLFILAIYDHRLKDITNIVFCDRDFCIKPLKNGNNLLSLAMINNKCDVVISSYTGASWVWFNRNIEINHKKILMFDDSYEGYDDIKTYIPKLNSWYRKSTQKDNDIIFYLNYDIDIAIQTLSAF
jgi:hypothetical protein